MGILRQLLQAALTGPVLGRTKVSLLVAPVSGGEPLFAWEPDARRVPASNAKLLTSSAAALVLPGKYTFVTEISVGRPGGPLYLWGTGDPVLRGSELNRLARLIRNKGVTRVRGVVVDDSYFKRRRLAPGFESFLQGSHYRPTSGPVNVDGNAVVIKVSATADRKRPKVDIFPPSDYVKVRKLVRFTRKRSRRRARNGRNRRNGFNGKARISVRIQPKGSIMWVTVSGKMDRDARPWSTKRAVFDPALNAGWALRRALVTAGIQVDRGVSRGRRPKKARILVRHARSLASIIHAVNQDSDNLAAENLVRAMGSLSTTSDEGEQSKPAATKATGHRPGSWEQGLERIKQAVASQLEISDFWLGNGSGLHRRSWVTARALTELLRKIYDHETLRRLVYPTLAIAGKTGTLRRRLRDTAAEGRISAKTGTLGNVLALSGYVDPQGEKPLAFSILVNGRAGQQERACLDRIAVVLSQYVQGLDLKVAPVEPATQPVEPAAPASQPVEPASPAEPAEPASPESLPAGSASQPVTPASQPAAPASQPAAPASQPTAPASQPTAPDTSGS